MTDPTNTDLTNTLLPVEDLALTIARSYLDRGENPPINTTTVLVMTLDRLVSEIETAR